MSAGNTTSSSRCAVAVTAASGRAGKSQQPPPPPPRGPRHYTAAEHQPTPQLTLQQPPASATAALSPVPLRNAKSCLRGSERNVANIHSNLHNIQQKLQHNIQETYQNATSNNTQGTALEQTFTEVRKEHFRSSKSNRVAFTQVRQVSIESYTHVEDTELDTGQSNLTTIQDTVTVGHAEVGHTKLAKAHTFDTSDTSDYAQFRPPHIQINTGLSYVPEAPQAEDTPDSNAEERYQKPQTMYYTSSSGTRYHGPQEKDNYWVPQSILHKEQVSEKRQQYQQNKTMFPNVSTHRRTSGRHAPLQQSLSAEGYLEPTISGVGDPGENHLSVNKVHESRSWHDNQTAPKGYFHHSPLLGVRSVSAEVEDDEGLSQYSAHSSITDRHSYHGSSRAIMKEVSPEPQRRSSYNYPPPPPPIRTPPVVHVTESDNREAKAAVEQHKLKGSTRDLHRDKQSDAPSSTLKVSTHMLQRQMSHEINETTADAEVNMSAPTRIVLLACGSFNPITNMHLRMFEVARDALHRSGRFRVIGGIISPVSDHYNKQDLLPAKHRCAMLRSALKTSDWIRMDTWESEQDAWSPTVKVLRHHGDKLETAYNANSDASSKKRKLDSNISQDSDYSTCASSNNVNESPVQVKLLCGADLLESFDTPNLWLPEDMEEIVGKFGIVVISRSGSNAEQFVYDNDVLSRHQNNIFLVTEWIQNDISATKIRRALRRGESVKYLLQDSVLDYINTHKLYGAGDNKLMNYITPSPNDESYDHFNNYTSTSMTPSALRHSPHYVASTSAQQNYVITNEHPPSSSIHSNDNRYHDNRYVVTTATNTPKDRTHGFRRHRGDLNYDEEFRRKDYGGRRSESLDRKPLVRSSTFDKNADFHKRVSSSFDSLDSPPRTRRPPPTLSAASSTTEMTGLVRRVHGMKIVSVTPETSV